MSALLRPLLLFVCWLSAAAACVAGGKKDDASAVSFHLETEAGDNPKMIFQQPMPNGQARHFRRMPEISSKDLTAFSPFPADDGVSYGVMFKLKGNAQRRLNAVSTNNQGRWLLAMANGRAVDAVLIDKPVDDGFIVIWQGVTEQEIKQLDKALPRLGEDQKR